MSFKNLLANVCFLCIGGLLGFNFSPTTTSDEPAQCQDVCYRRTHSGFSLSSLSGESKVCHFKNGFRFCIRQKRFDLTLPKEKSPDLCDKNSDTYKLCYETSVKYNQFISEVRNSKSGDIITIPDWYMETWFMPGFFEEGVVEVTKLTDTDEIYYGYQTEGGGEFDHLQVSIDGKVFYYWVTRYS